MESSVISSRFPCRVLLLVFCIGCGEPESSGPVTVIPEDQSVPESAIVRPDPPPPKSVERRSDEVWVDDEGRKYIGRVPYDVFFDNPLEIALEGQTVDSSLVQAGTSAPRRDIEAGNMPPSERVAATAESNSAVDWSIQLPVSVLESEIKSARNFLNEKLQSVANYNSAVTMIPVRAAMIALLSSVASEHPGDISWKEDALYVRDLARGMNQSVLKRGPNDQRRLLRIFEDLVDTLNRSRPAGLDEPSSDVTLSDAAGMGMIMQRIKESEQWLRTEVTNSGFSSQAQIVQHEASLMVGLGQVMTQESYGYSDDSDFLAHANRLIEAGQEMRDATEGGQFAEFELGLTKAAGSCQSCHRDYRSN